MHWIHGGTTSVDNAILLCGRHHDRLHHDTKAILIHPDGTRTVHPTPASASTAPIYDQRASP